MQKLFGERSKFVFYGSKVWDLMYLNLLTVLCCLPVFTAGASLTAMHYVLLRIYRDEDCGISRDFFHCFRRDFVTATEVWLIHLVLGLVLLFDYLAVIRQGLIRSTLFEGLFYCIVFLFLMAATWTYILLSRYQESLGSLIRDSLITGAGYFFHTLVMAALTLFPLILLAFLPRLLPILVLFWFTGSGLFQTMLYSKVFKTWETGKADGTSPLK